MNQLVEELMSSGVLKSPHIVEAFLHTDRADFVPEPARKTAYINEPLHIGYGQTISQPWTVAFMLEELLPQPGERILDIGSGSGWQSALLAYIVSHDSNGNNENPTENGHIIGLELVPELVKQGIFNISKYNYIKKGIVEIHCLNAESGYKKGAPFDRIIAAAAAESIPLAWKEQLVSGGVLVAPLETSIVKLKKKSDGRFDEKRFEGFAFVPFINGED